jgi:hypothetical protein
MSRAPGKLKMIEDVRTWRERRLQFRFFAASLLLSILNKSD